ncbi:MAG: hypothetical protein U0271_48535 [Polyangiaceae bacterium]
MMRQKLGWPLVLAMGGVLVGTSGCELIAAVDHNLIDQGGNGGTGGTTSSTGGTTAGGQGGTGGTTGGTGGVGGTGGTGGMPECSVPGDCPNAPECQSATCDAGSCGLQDDAINDPCTLQGGGNGFCDGSGSCFECLSTGQCNNGQVCDTNAHSCVDPTCADGQKNGTETDKDCGGNCGGCANNLMCGDGGDCLSGFCNGGTCAACTLDNQCTGNTFCSAGSCVAKLLDGSACTATGQCLNGHCNDIGSSGAKMCCNVDCVAGCQSCSAGDNTGQPNGVCANIQLGSDPKNSCSSGECVTGTCDGANACGNRASGFACGTPSCSGEDLQVDQCDGSGTCQNNASTQQCGAYNCNTGSNACFTTCNAQGDCDANSYCVLGTAQGTMMTCLGKKGTGGSCNEDFECQAGPCAANLCP